MNLRTLLVAGMIACLLLPGILRSQEKKNADRGKSFVEAPLKVELAKLGADELRTKYAPKARIEAPTKRVVAGSAEPENPKVTPGKIKWHADFETACRAAKQSGKPVLLFQMMGNLDERFC